MPNVSYSKQENEVHYNPLVDPANGHPYVEIAGVKWATMNVGATNETDAGLYFQWGDTQGYTASQVGSGSGQKAFTWADYKYSNNGGSTAADMTKYNSTDGKTVLDLEDDAAHAIMGGNWRMPTHEELGSLFEDVDSSWTNNYNGTGVHGWLFTSSTDSSIKLFLPAVGQCKNGVYEIGDGGYYWSSSLSKNDKSEVHEAFFDPEFGGTGYYKRYCGLPVRGVLDA